MAAELQLEQAGAAAAGGPAPPAPAPGPAPRKGNRTQRRKQRQLEAAGIQLPAEDAVRPPGRLLRSAYIPRGKSAFNECD